MTQVSRYGHMLKVTVSGMRIRVTARYRVDGSVLNDTIQGHMLGAETTLEIDSPDPPERVAKVVRNGSWDSVGSAPGVPGAASVRVWQLLSRWREFAHRATAVEGRQSWLAPSTMWLSR